MSSTKAISQKDSAAKNILIVLLGALLMGFLWRIRGTNGWGSSWGLLNAGAIFSLFIVTIIGDRKKSSLMWIGISSLLFMLTVPTWGTFLDQITGFLSSSYIGPDGAENPLVPITYYIPQWQGVTIMLILGFGLATLWGIMIGRSLSDKQWRIRDFVLLIAVFMAAMYVSRATLAHTLARIIQPEALSLFEDGLNFKGESFESIYQIYMKHFDDMSWAKKITGGRNYFALVETISIAIGGIASMIVTRFMIKDKRAANMGFITSCAFAFAITVADLFFYFFDSANGVIGAKENIAAWSCWEYFTGFLAGLIITATVVIYKNKLGEDVSEKAFSTTPAKISDVLTFLLGYVVVLGINIVRPVLDRLEDTDFHIPAIIIAFIGAVIFIVLSIKKYGIDLQNSTQKAFAYKSLLVMMVYMFFIYMFTDFETKGANILSITNLHNIAMVISFVILAIYFAINVKKTLKDDK